MSPFFMDKTRPAPDPKVVGHASPIPADACPRCTLPPTCPRSEAERMNCRYRENELPLQEDELPLPSTSSLLGFRGKTRIIKWLPSGFESKKEGKHDSEKEPGCSDRR